MRHVPRPTPALVIACVALFISLGGVSYGFATGTIDSREIKNNDVRGKDIRNSTITTDDIRNDQVRGADIRNSTIVGRDVALDTLTGLDIKESTLGTVPTATNAANASNSAALGGVAAGGYARRTAPDFIDAGRGTVAYARDDLGYVHLRGTEPGGTGTRFTLPADARPAADSRFTIPRGTTGATSTLTITSAGEATLTPTGGGDAAYDGVTFAAGP